MAKSDTDRRRHAEREALGVVGLRPQLDRLATAEDDVRDRADDYIAAVWDADEAAITGARHALSQAIRELRRAGWAAARCDVDVVGMAQRGAL